MGGAVSVRQGAAGVPAVPIPCDGRGVDLPAASYDWIRVTLDVDTIGVETVWLYYEDGVEPEYLHMTAVGIVRARIAVPRRETLVGLRLPRNPGVKVLSLEPIPATRRMEGMEHE